MNEDIQNRIPDGQEEENPDQEFIREELEEEKFVERILGLLLES